MLLVHTHNPDSMHMGAMAGTQMPRRAMLAVAAKRSLAMFDLQPSAAEPQAVQAAVRPNGAHVLASRVNESVTALCWASFAASSSRSTGVCSAIRHINN